MNFLKKLFPQKASEPDKILTPSSRITLVTMKDFCYWCMLSPSLFVWDYHETYRSCVRCNAPHPDFFHLIKDKDLLKEVEEKFQKAQKKMQEAA